MLGIIFGSFSYDCTIERHLFVNISDTYLFEIANEVLVTLNLFFFLFFLFYVGIIFKNLRETVKIFYSINFLL